MVIYKALKTYKKDNVKYQCIPYSLQGTYQAFTNKIDFIKFLSKCYLSEKKCIKKCVKLNINYGMVSSR
jgi:hypothetical protein